MTELVSGVVLAGGASRRMGRDKRTVAVGGRPMLGIALGLVAEVSDELIVSCRRDDPPDSVSLEGRSVRLVFDRREGGPMAGLETVLAIAEHDLSVVVPVDMPWLTTRPLVALVEAACARPEAHGAVFSSPSGLSPFPAVYRRSSLPFVSRQLDAGEFRLRDLLRQLDLVSVPLPAADERGPSYVNVNTLADLARTEHED